MGGCAGETAYASEYRVNIVRMETVWTWSFLWCGRVWQERYIAANTSAAYILDDSNFLGGGRLACPGATNIER